MQPKTEDIQKIYLLAIFPTLGPYSTLPQAPELSIGHNKEQKPSAEDFLRLSDRRPKA